MSTNLTLQHIRKCFLEEHTSADPSSSAGLGPAHEQNGPTYNSLGPLWHALELGAVCAPGNSSKILRISNEHVVWMTLLKWAKLIMLT